jgi:TP901 family phage tail tape measure protein
MANESNIDVNVRATDGLSPQLAQMESKLIRFVGAVSSAFTALKVVGFPVTAVRNFEAQMANVQKTTNFTDTQVKNLGDSLVDLSRKINVSAVDLAKIASAAGQQGLGKEGVEGIRQFTESVSRLGSVLDLTAEEAGASIGKIASIFKVSLQDIEGVSSAFNQVSNNSTATGEQLLDIVKRIGNAAGSISLEQSIGLAATGIDLGQSPEVVGTSYAKIFSEMFSQADKFSKLLGMTVKDYVADLSKDGIGTYKKYLAALRNLSGDEQQKVIKTMSGGGRIGVLVTKNVQDTENEILDKNLRDAAEGRASGVSAIREQLTVLKTMDAQIAELGNSFQALGIKSGEVFGPKLTGYIGQLKTALADPAIIHFAQGVGTAFLDLFDTIAAGVKFLANLNVNWENFVSVIKVFLGMKLAQVIMSSMSGIPLLGGALTKLGLDAVKAGEQQVAGSAKANTAIQNQIIRIKELLAARTAYSDAVAKQTAAEIAQSKALDAQHKAEAANLAAANALKLNKGIARTNVAAAGAGITAAKSGVAGAEASAIAANAAARQRLNDKIAAAEARHQARMAEIVAQGEAARAEAKAAGSKLGVAAVNAAEAEMLAAEKTYQTKSLASLNAYHTKRIAAVAAAGAAEVAASKGALMASLTQFDTVAKGTGFGVLTVNAQKAAIALNQADRDVVKTTAALEAAKKVTTEAGAGYARFATAVKLVGNAFSLLIGVAAKAFFWLTIIYTALDAFGLLDNLSGTLAKVTDWLGLTSEAQRKNAEAAKQATEEQDKYNKSLEESIEVMQKFIDKRTGLFSAASLETLKLNLGDEDANTAAAARDQLKEMVAGTYADLSKASTTQSALPGLAKNTKAELDKTLAAIEQGNARIEQLQEQQARNANSRFGGVMQGTQITQQQAEVKELEALAARLRGQLVNIGPDAAAATDGAVQTTKKNLETLKSYVTDAFSPQSAEAFTRFVPPYLAAIENVKKATEDAQVAAQNFTNSRGTAAEKTNKEIAEAAIVTLDAANRVKDQVEKNLDEYLEHLKSTGGLSAAFVGSLDRLPDWLHSSEPQLRGILKILQDIAGAGAAATEATFRTPGKNRTGDFSGFTGKLAGGPVTADAGTGTAPGKGDTGSEARALSKARVELIRAGLQAEANLSKQHITEQQAALEEANKLQLKSIKDYYAQRLSLNQQNNDIEQKLKRDEIAALGKEQGEADKESSRVRIQAQIVKAKGELDLLIEQRRALVDTNKRDEDAAVLEFSDKVTNQRNALVDFFGATSDTESFQLALDAAAVSYRDFVTKLRTEAEGQPELLKLADAVELQGKFQATEAALNHIGREAALTSGQFDVLNSRIDMLRDNGTITGIEASAAYASIRRHIIAVKEAELARAEEQLKQAYDINKSLEEQSLRYKELALQVAEGRVTLEGLKTQGADVAVEINQNLHDSFSEALQGLAQGEDVQEALTDFALSIINSLSKAAADGLADMLIKNLGGMTGGLGGLFADLAGANGPGGGVGGVVKGAVGATKDPDIIEQGLTAVTGGLSSLGTTLMGGLSSVTGGITTALGQGWQFLVSFMGPMFSAIVAAITGGQTAEAATGLISAIGGAAAAHNGGIAGHFTMTKSGIGVMATPVEYHTGGLVGMAPDEVSAVLKKGEEVITEEDPRHRNNLGKGNKEKGDAERSIRVVPVLDPSAIHEAISSSQGEDVIVAVMKRKAATLRQILK